ncbi:hypothetical protein BGZ95_006260 [Linnemannia exigua]|uniref:Uncharacterized protein n=1 Tax=Linnemannia exigua TaxID=604196 RepID=A0AAD4H162_9FUNG|nr:hypothetical protein BGZ95_006260 [Linnemannia exigua]
MEKTLDVAVFVGSHTDVGVFKKAYPLVSSQLLGGDRGVMTSCIELNIIIPINTKFDVTVGKHTDWMSYQNKLKALIRSHLETTDQAGVDWSWVIEQITAKVMEAHLKKIVPSVIFRNKRNYFIYVDDYINKDNTKLLSFSAQFDVQEKGETLLNGWNIQIDGKIEVKFLQLI